MIDDPTEAQVRSAMLFSLFRSAEAPELMSRRQDQRGFAICSSARMTRRCPSCLCRPSEKQVREKIV